MEKAVILAARNKRKTAQIQVMSEMNDRQI